jgi:hypothetical protein
VIRTFRGAWSRRWTLLPLLLLTTVVVGGTATVVSFADAAGTSRVLAAPLLLLGLVAVPGTARELAIARRQEVALARLRGLEGGELSTLLTTEPLLVLGAGAVVGLGVAAVGGPLSTTAWADHATGSGALGLAGVLVALVIVVVALVAVVVGVAGALNEPLVQQVSIATRPRPSTVVATFGSVLVVMAAVVASYRSSVSGTDPDWVVLAGPALVGLAVGQVVSWLMQALARVAVPATARRGMGMFLAVRRLARVADAARPVRLLVAAAVVAALAATGATQVTDWTDDTARLRAGAPLRVPLDADAPSALRLSREIDPDGKYLMAAVLVPGTGAIPNRRGFLDTTRFGAVLGDFYQGTPAAGVGERVADLGGGATGLATGDTVTATVRGVSPRREGRMRPKVRVGYATGGGGTDHHVDFEFAVGHDGAADTKEAPLRGCAEGCTVTSLRFLRTRGDVPLPWLLTELDVGGTDALALDWLVRDPTGYGEPISPVVVDEGLLAVSSRFALDTVAQNGAGTVPVLATRSAVWPDGPPQLDSPGGDERPASVLARLPGLPLVEADGVLADLPRAAAGAPPTVPAAEVMMLARSDTPSSMLEALDGAASGRPRTLADFRDQTTEQSRSSQASAYTLMAICCLLVALLVLATAVGRQRLSWLRDVAALRVVGVDSRRLRRAGTWEVVSLTMATLIGTAVGAVVAVRLLLPNLSLVDVPEHSVPLHSSLAVAPVVIATAAAALLVLLVAGRGRTVGEASSRPALLREEAPR